MDSILKLPTPKKVLILVGDFSVPSQVLFLYVLIIPRQDELKVAKGELSKLEQELNKSKSHRKGSPKI